MTSWIVPAAEQDRALAHYREHGFVAFIDLLSPAEMQEIGGICNEAIAAGRLRVGEEAVAENADCIYADPRLENLPRHPALVAMARHLIGSPVELQHAKFNAKPRREGSPEGEIRWHQDYPFFPHTNFDLVACGLHLDAEDATSGPVSVLPGSHLNGVQSHVRDGRFVYEMVDMAGTQTDVVDLVCPQPFVTFHHALLAHRSAPKQGRQARRLLVMQYRAQDAIQLAGVIGRATGLEVEPPQAKGYAHFPDGTRVEIRGTNGRLYDLHGKLAPDRPNPATPS
jgi:phytanoyl-CoA hydroxylase